MPEVHLSRSEVNLRRSEVHLLRSEVNLWRPEMHLWRSEVNLRRSEVDLLRPEMHFRRPEANLRSPEIHLRRSEIHLRHPTTDPTHPNSKTTHRPPSKKTPTPQPPHPTFTIPHANPPHAKRNKPPLNPTLSQPLQNPAATRSSSHNRRASIANFCPIGTFHHSPACNAGSPPPSSSRPEGTLHGFGCFTLVAACLDGRNHVVVRNESRLRRYNDPAPIAHFHFSQRWLCSIETGNRIRDRQRDPRARLQLQALLDFARELDAPVAVHGGSHFHRITIAVSVSSVNSLGWISGQHEKMAGITRDDVLFYDLCRSTSKMTWRV